MASELSSRYVLSGANSVYGEASVKTTIRLADSRTM